MDATAPYLNGPQNQLQMHVAEGRRTTRGSRSRTGRTWARRRSRPTCRSRATSWRAAIDEAHKRGLKITGHLCSVTLRGGGGARHRQSRARLHGGDRFRRRQAARRRVPGQAVGQQTIAALDENGAPFKALVKKLIDEHVALTSTLTVFETFTPGRPMPPGLDVLLPELKAQFEQNYAAHGAEPAVDLQDAAFPKAIALERAFATRRRPAHRRHRSDRRRRRHPGLLEPAADRAAGRGGLHAARSDPHLHAERRDVSWARRARRHRSPPASRRTWS